MADVHHGNPQTACIQLGLLQCSSWLSAQYILMGVFSLTHHIAACAYHFACYVMTCPCVLCVAGDAAPAGSTSSGSCNARLQQAVHGVG